MSMICYHGICAVNKDTLICMFDETEFRPTNMTDGARMILSNEFNVDALVDTNLDIDTIEMYLILIGSSLFDWLETPNKVTGLYPFMSMAKLSTYNLEDVYDVAMMNLNSIFQSNCVLQESMKNIAIHTDERTRDTKRDKLA